MKRSRFIVLSLLLDAVLVNAGIVASFYLRFGGDGRTRQNAGT